MTPSIRVMHALDAAGIANCHWKSNEHLEAALNGQTDLDLLVDPDFADEALAVIAATGFRRFPSHWSRSYPGLDDHLALDENTDRLHHLHLHFALDAGEAHLKSYRLPWVHHVLGGRMVDPAYGVHVTRPDTEAVLLLTRATMKMGLRARLRREGLSTHDAVELDWLLERTTLDAITAEADALLGNGPLVREVADRRTFDSLLALRRHVRAALARHRRYPALFAPLAGAVRTVAWAGAGVGRRVFDRPIRFARHVPGEGRVVAVVGPDGAGKSTLTTTLVEALGREIDTMAAYMGSGDGAASLLRRPLLALRARRGTTSATFAADGTRVRSPTPALALWALLIAYEKRSALRRIRTAKRRGLVVIADRWPQVTVPGHNDGPLLDAWSDGSGWRRYLARWERKHYDAAVAFGPDLMIRLRVSPAVAAERRPDHDPEDLGRRIDLVARLEFPSASSVIDIDADLPAKSVAGTALEAVWATL